MNIKDRRRQMLEDQQKWITQCGGDMAGYMLNYQGRHNRTTEEVIAIFNADMEELRRLERLVK